MNALAAGRSQANAVIMCILPSPLHHRTRQAAAPTPPQVKYVTGISVFSLSGVFAEVGAMPW